MTDTMDIPPVDPARPGTSWRDYHRVTRTATYGFLMALPLLLLYEGLILLVNQGQVMQVRISAEVWIKQFFATFGATGWHVLAVVVLLIGIGIFFYERKKRLSIRPRYFGWMYGESAIFAIVLAMLVSTAVGVIFAAVPVHMESLPLASAREVLFQEGLTGFQEGLTQLALSIGAGLYEELFFRVLLVGGLYLLLKNILRSPIAAYMIAAVVGALLFSAVHYIGALGDAFTLSSFTFRFLFGLALNVVFLVRGFGVAAWTHALYDIMVVGDQYDLFIVPGWLVVIASGLFVVFMTSLLTLMLKRDG